MQSVIAKLLLVRGDEKKQVIYFFILYAILGCGIAFGRNSTDVLFFKRFGVEYLPFMYVGLSFFLAAVSILYASFSDRISPEKLSIAIFGVLIFLLVANWSWINFTNSDLAYPAYFLLYEAASEILLVHSAHYISQNFSSLQAKRLFPIIMAGTQVGIIVGSIVIAVSAEHIKIQEVLLFWSLLLSVNMIMIFAWYKKNGTSRYFRAAPKSSDKLQQAVSQVTYGISLIKSSKMLRAASYALFFMVITFYILSYSVNKIYTQTFTTEAELSSFFGVLSATTNGVALFLQIFITNRIIYRYGVKKVNLLFPVTSLASYFALMSSFSLWPAIIGSINKDVIMPAFRNPVRSIFFSTLPENVQGRARSTSVVIVLPLALLVCGLLLILLQTVGNEKYFLGLGVVTGLIYLYFNLQMNKAYVTEILSTLRSKFFVPTGSEDKNGKSLHNPADDSNDNLDIFKNTTIAKLFNILMDLYPDKGRELLSQYEDINEHNITDQIIQILALEKPPGFNDLLWDLYQENDEIRLKSTIITILFVQRYPRVTRLITELLQSDNLRIRCAAIIGALHHENKVERNEAKKIWRRLISSDDENEQIASIDLLKYLYLEPDFLSDILTAYKSTIQTILKKGDKRKINIVLNALQRWPESQFPEIAQLLNDVFDQSTTVTRLLCVKCSYLIYDIDQELLKKAIEDSNPLVRQEAARVHYEVAGEDAKDIIMLWLSTEANGSPKIQKAFLGLFHDISIEDEKLEQIALGKAELARHFFLGHQFLSEYTGKESAAFQLVKYILQERIKQYIELSVYAIRGGERDEDTRLLNSCINSRDSRHIANACEVLRNFKHQKIGQVLLDLVDNKPINLKDLQDPRFHKSPQSVLLWCKKLPDPWLRLCANEALKSL